MMMTITERKRKKALKGCISSTKNINNLQSYYSIAVRACSGRTIQEMKRDNAAALYHCCEFNTDDQRHMFCTKTRGLGVNTRLV